MEGLQEISSSYVGPLCVKVSAELQTLLCENKPTWFNRIRFYRKTTLTQLYTLKDAKDKKEAETVLSKVEHVMGEDVEGFHRYLSLTYPDQYERKDTLAETVSYVVQKAKRFTYNFDKLLDLGERPISPLPLV